MHKVPFLNRGRLSISECEIPDCTPDLLASATDYKNPPSEFAVSQSEEDLKRPRRYLGLHTLRKGIAEFLVTGLETCLDGDGRVELRLPEKGSVRSEAIDDISKTTSQSRVIVILTTSRSLPSLHKICLPTNIPDNGNKRRSFRHLSYVRIEGAAGKERCTLQDDGGGWSWSCV